MIAQENLIFGNEFKTKSIRNIAFFYTSDDSISSKDSLQWSACAQLIYTRGDSAFDQIFLIDQITESPYSLSNKIDLKIAQFVLNFDNSFNKGVFAVNYNKIRDNNDFFSSKPLSPNNLHSELRNNNETSLIKIFYYKKDVKSVEENVIIQQDQIVLKVLLKDKPFAREYVLASPTNRNEKKVEVLIL